MPFPRTSIGSDREYFEGKKTSDIVDPEEIIPRPSPGRDFSIFYADGEIYITYSGDPQKVEGLDVETAVRMARRGLQARIGRYVESITQEYKDLDGRLAVKHRMIDKLREEDEKLRAIMLSTMKS